MRRLSALLSLLGTLLAAPVAAQPLVADLSDHLISITMGFEGAELLLFGAVEDEGDIVVVIYGPREDITVRRKGQVGPIWMNRDHLSFTDVPAFYRIMATRPLGKWLPNSVRERHQIGVDHLELQLATPREEIDLREAELFRKALIRRKQAVEHYATDTGLVSMLSARLFRTDVLFPTNVPVGTYTVEVFLLRDGEVVSAQSTPLYVSKTGALAEIFLVAHDYSALYGIAAIIFAVLAGLGANAVFRKV